MNKPIPTLTETQRARFDASFVRGDGCWNWIGCVHPTGYGQFSLNRSTYRAHRVAYTIANGPIPSGMVICHSCDNPTCVNPQHLWAGSQAENMRDCATKGRINRGGSRGKMPSAYRPRLNNPPRHSVPAIDRDGKIMTCRKCGHLRVDDYFNGKKFSRCAKCQQARTATRKTRSAHSEISQ